MMKIIKLTIILGAALLIACGRPPVEERLADESLFRGVSLIGMSVSKLDKSVAAYKTAFDFAQPAQPAELLPLRQALAAEAGLPSVPQSALLRSTNAQILMSESGAASARAPVPVNGVGIAHVCFQADKDLETYRKFLDNGAKVIGDPEMQRLSPISPVTYAYIHEPDGAVIEVEHLDMFWIPDSMTEGFDRRVRHVSFASADIDRLMNFYQKFLNVQKPRLAPNLVSEKMDGVSGYPGTEVTMGWMHVGNLELEFVQYHSHPPEPAGESRTIADHGYNFILLDVSDVEKASARFVDAGGELLPATTGEGAVWGRDVDGNLIGMMNINRDSDLSSLSFDYLPKR